MMTFVQKAAGGLLVAFSVVLASGCSSDSSSKTASASAGAADYPLSPAFEANCARCHGPLGKGGFGPDLSGRDVASLENAVRTGFPGQMPAFDAARYPDAALNQDAAYFASVPVKGKLTVGTAADQFANASHFLGEGDGSHAVLGLFGLEPFVQPYVKCIDLPDIDQPSATKHVCVNAIISGSTEPGYRFADFGVCQDIRTQRPYSPKPVKAVVNSADDARLKDPKFMAELDWVNSQIRSSGCVCCHDSQVSKLTATWDISAPNNPIWTDQLGKYATEIFTGRVDSTALGAFPASINHGFDRLVTGLPSTDPQRMKSFFLKRAAELGTTPAEIAVMPPLADVLASQLRDKPKACPQGVGVYADHSVHWTYLDLGDIVSSLGSNQDPQALLNKILGAVPLARYVYVLKADSVTPLVPPNLDRPAGMLWRLDRAREALPFVTGLPKYPTPGDSQLPPLATQAFPEGGALPEALVPGQTYYLDAQIDMAFPAARCLFTFPAG